MTLMMHPCKFTFDDSPTFDGFSHESRWNGFDNVAVTAAERERIKLYFLESNTDEATAEADDLMAIEPIENSDPPLYSLGWGYATQIVQPYVRRDGDEAVIAARFVEVLRAWLDADEWNEMGARNAGETDANICHSHDFCDANMAMCEAYASVTGAPPDADNESEAKLWGTAWALAMPYLTKYTAEWRAK